MSDPHASIGIFDSGFGGLTVMRAIRSLLPHENIVYFGDTAHLPYGDKSAATVLGYCIENSRFLVEQGIKLLVVACNTACSWGAIEAIGKLFSIPLIGVIEPGVMQTLRASKTGRIAILGTRGTILSKVHQTELERLLPQAHLISISCPLFVPLVEEGYTNHLLTEMVVQEYLRPLRNENIDTVLLGCTHYPLLQNAIRKELGSSIQLIDPAISCAESVKSYLSTNALLNPSSSLPSYKFYVSDDPEKFRLLGYNFLEFPIQHVDKKRF